MPRPGTPGLPGDVGIAGESPERQETRTKRARAIKKESRMIGPIMTTEARTWIHCQSGRQQRVEPSLSDGGADVSDIRFVLEDAAQRLVDQLVAEGVGAECDESLRPIK